MSTTSPLPPLYSRWMDELLAAPIPPEEQATCSDCAMCPTGGQTVRGLATFDPGIKCCTFIPELWNFLVGRVLADEDPAAAEGRATVIARLESGRMVTPLGLGKSPAHRTLYREGGAAEFGRTKTYRCPHYLADGRCGVWRHRESTCATWFCKYERGAVGMTFWKSLHGLLALVERSLSMWCLLELDLGAEALGALCPPPGVEAPAPNLEGEYAPAARATLWGDWAGRERELYLACAKKVDALGWADVLRLCGPDVRVAAALVQEHHRALVSDALPERVAPGTWQMLEPGAQRSLLVTYNPLDPIAVPSVLLRLLPRFDGRPIGEVLEEIAREERINVTPSLVRRLVDYKVLVRS